MPSTTTDRLYGLTTSVFGKGPVRAATTAAITLSGEQTVDGVALVTDDRVLVKNQANAVYNGVWIVQTGDWTRAADYNGSLDTVTGTIVEVNFGAVNAVTLWRCTSTGVIVIGTDAITWEPLSLASGANTLLVPWEFLGTPDAGAIMGIFVCKDAATFAADLAGGAGYSAAGWVGTNPAATFTSTIELNGVEVATATISTGGVWTFATTAGLAFSVEEDDVLTWVADSDVSTAAYFGLSFAGSLD